MYTSRVLLDFDERGLIAQATDYQALDEHLGSSSRVLYAGFDPTASSLHIGNLVPLLALRRFQLAGHKPIALLGGATGLIGDPSGKSQERQLTDSIVVEEWIEQISKQLSHYLDTDGNYAAKLVNNLQWSQDLRMIPFLREIGKQFSVNVMMQRDSVKTRLEREESGISFTEFTYMLFQANDFLELNKRYQCTLQIGGSDQWGNIVSGIDLVRRVTQEKAFGLTLNLLTKNDGSKFGKTADGAVWLDSALTSPYRFYQFWINTSDEDMPMLMSTLSMKDPQERAERLQSLKDHPERREAPKALAQELTQLVHGDQGLSAATRITRELFSGDIRQLKETDLDQLWQDGLDRATILGSEVPVFVAMHDAGLARSRSAARRLITSKSVSVNGESITDQEQLLTPANAMFGRFHLLRRGRKSWCIVQHGAQNS